MKILVVSSLSGSLTNFRRPLLKKLVDLGHSVVAFGPDQNPDVVRDLKDINVTFESYPLARTGLNPAKDLATVWALRKSFCRHRPDIILSYTVKPVIYCGIALITARGLYQCRYFPMITGLGFTGNASGFVYASIRRVIHFLLIVSLKRAQGVIFQNRDDLAYYQNQHLLPADLPTKVVAGSGVDLSHFEAKPSSQAAPHQPLKFLMIARLIQEKGLVEFLQAAEMVTREQPGAAEFSIAGGFENRPNSFAVDDAKKWEKAGVARFLGELKDVRPWIEACDVYVLPSYREGMPRTVLEAMAIGRPIITTDTPGCRETVVPGINGFLVPPRNPKALADAMFEMIKNRQVLADMGRASLLYCRKQFDSSLVTADVVKFLGA